MEELKSQINSIVSSVIPDKAFAITQDITEIIAEVRLLAQRRSLPDPVDETVFLNLLRHQVVKLKETESLQAEIESLFRKDLNVPGGILPQVLRYRKWHVGGPGAFEAKLTFREKVNEKLGKISKPVSDKISKVWQGVKDLVDKRKKSGADDKSLPSDSHDHDQGAKEEQAEATENLCDKGEHDDSKDELSDLNDGDDVKSDPDSKDQEAAKEEGKPEANEKEAGKPSTVFAEAEGASSKIGKKSATGSTAGTTATATGASAAIGNASATGANAGTHASAQGAASSIGNATATGATASGSASAESASFDALNATATGVQASVGTSVTGPGASIGNVSVKAAGVSASASADLSLKAGNINIEGATAGASIAFNGPSFGNISLAPPTSFSFDCNPLNWFTNLGTGGSGGARQGGGGRGGEGGSGTGNRGAAGSGGRGRQTGSGRAGGGSRRSGGIRKNWRKHFSVTKKASASLYNADLAGFYKVQGPNATKSVTKTLAKNARATVNSVRTRQRKVTNVFKESDPSKRVAKSGKGKGPRAKPKPKAQKKKPNDDKGESNPPQSKQETESGSGSGSGSGSNLAHCSAGSLDRMDPEDQEVFDRVKEMAELEGMNLTEEELLDLIQNQRQYGSGSEVGTGTGAGSKNKKDGEEEEEDDPELCQFCKARGHASCMKCLLGKGSKKVKKISGMANDNGFN